MKLTRTIFMFLALALSLGAVAQSLTPAQQNTLRNDINSRPTLAAQLAAGEDQAVADWYNAQAQAGEYTAPLTCWKPNYTVQGANAAIDWAAHAALSQAKQLAYLALTQTGTIDLTDNQVRAGITAIYGAASATETTIFSADTSSDGAANLERGARSGSRFEVLFGGIRGTSRRCMFFGQRLTPQVVSGLR